MKLPLISARPSTVGNKSPYTSEYTINIGADFSKELNNGSELTARFDYRITGPTFFHTVQGVNTSQWASFAPVISQSLNVMNME